MDFQMLADLDATLLDVPSPDFFNISSDELSTTSSQTGTTPMVSTRRKPIPRKGHTKSRRGCFTCKKRKIKCQETWPRCGNCEKAGMTCEYPNPPNIAERSMVRRDPSPIVQPQATSAVFGMQDMQFFHHFLFRAYPHLPIKSDNLWTSDIPSFAHEYDYLMHSMLGLGASHLALTAHDPTEFNTRALTHRVEAIRLLNKALSIPAKSGYEGDARFATFMVLIFQSACMPDGLVDFMTMLRGCIWQGHANSSQSLFSIFAEDEHLVTMEEMVKDLKFEPMNDEVLEGMVSSLQYLEPFCKLGVERRYLAMLTQSVQRAGESAHLGYIMLTKLYNFIDPLSHEEFSQLIDKNNCIAQILLCHFLAYHLIIGPIISFESPHRDLTALWTRFAWWANDINDRLPQALQELNEWPISFIIRRLPALTGYKEYPNITQRRITELPSE